MPIESEIMDGFWHSRCLNNRIDLSDMIGTLASGTNASLMAKIGTKDLLNLAHSIESEIMDGFWQSRCINGLIDILLLIGSLAGGATSSMVAQN